MKALFFGFCIGIATYPMVGFSEDWTPRPTFSVEGSNYIETLTFISGISYGLAASKKELTLAGLGNFYCYPEESDVDSKVLFDLLNKRLSGDHTSEEIINTVTSQLNEKYPCNK